MLVLMVLMSVALGFRQFRNARTTGHKMIPTPPQRDIPPCILHICQVQTLSTANIAHGVPRWAGAEAPQELAHRGLREKYRAVDTTNKVEDRTKKDLRLRRTDRKKTDWIAAEVRDPSSCTGHSR